MATDFLLVHTSILPSSLPKVLLVRSYLEKDSLSVSEACKKAGISRSVYYKYKDKVYAVGEASPKKAILSLKVEDVPGVLSSSLALLSKEGANVLTISQDLPLHSIAYIHLMINVTSLGISMEDLLKELRAIPHVEKAEVLSYE
jgi:chorismate mutase